MYKRDSQRQAVYDAEREAFAKDCDVNYTLEESVELMKRLLKSSVVKQLFKNANRRKPELPRIRFDQKGCPWANNTQMHLRPSFNSFWVVIHEFTHFVRNNITSKEAYHGREFCRTYFDLMYWFDVERGKKLRASFKKHNVKYRALPKLSATERARRKDRFLQNIVEKAATTEGVAE